VETLRKRLEVVERIVTDASTSQAHDTRRLASEIEALRDR
jgi:ABC-type phosphate transport system auxiliary subunit